MATERQTINMAWLRRKMSDYHITQVELAAEANFYQSNLSAFLNGKEYLGVVRSARLREAIDRLVAEKSAQRELVS